MYLDTLGSLAPLLTVGTAMINYFIGQLMQYALLLVGRYNGSSHNEPSQERTPSIIIITDNVHGTNRI